MLLWRWAFTLTIVSTAVGVSATAWDTRIDRFTTPNVAVLILEEAFIASVGCTFIYLLTLLYEKAPQVGVWGIVVGLTVVEISIFICWLAAPVHSREVKSVYVYGAHMPSVQAFAVLFFGTLMVELTASAVFTVRLTRTIHAADPTGQWGGWIIAVSTGAGAAVFLLATFLVFIRPGSSTTAALSEVLRNFCALIVIGIMVGAIVMVGGPKLLRFRSRRKYASRLQPLWEGLIRLFPVIALDRRPNTLRDLVGGNGLERMLIEIHDGLDMLLVRNESVSVKVVAYQIVSLPSEASEHGLVAATNVLPSMATEQEERDVLCSLADYYQQRRAAITADAN